jgi:hypothetical protein
MGPNFFIWIAMAVAVASTIWGLNGHALSAALGYAVAVALAVFNKVRMIRRGRGAGMAAVAPNARRLIGYIAAGIIGGALFFAALTALILGGLREPYVSILIACGAGALFAGVYLRAASARRKREEQSSQADPPNVR